MAKRRPTSKFRARSLTAEEKKGVVCFWRRKKFPEEAIEAPAPTAQQRQQKSLGQEPPPLISHELQKHQNKPLSAHNFYFCTKKMNEWLNLDYGH